MTDAIVRNVSLQASVKIAEESTKEYEETISLLDAEIGKLNEELQVERQSRSRSENSRIRELENQVFELSRELDDLRSSKKHVEDNKHQLQHVDTFRKELLLSREENQKLKDEIEYLKLSPAKRKKIDEMNTQKQLSPVAKINTEETVKDGGIF